ncbi:MAG TPA: hypothetical protein VGQ83_02465 [Polyangia bacterium]|jgi:hypothetical protein
MRPFVLVFAAALAAASCTTERQGLLTTDIVSYRVTLKSPQNVGTADAPLQEDNPHTVTFDVEALGSDGQVRTDYNAELKLWVYYDGTLTPVADQNGSETVALVNGGVYDVTRVIPLAFGPTTIWIEDVRRTADGHTACDGPYSTSADRCSYATGASKVINYRNPFLDEVQRPVDPSKPEATCQSQLQGKSVYVDRPRDIDSKLVVTGAYSQAFTVTDVSPSAMAIGYNHIYVFSFGRAKRNDGTAIAAGDTVVSCESGRCKGYLSGGVKEFVGFTELDFPLYDVGPPPDDAPECRCGLSFRPDGSPCETKVWAPCPEPVTLDPTWLKGIGDPTFQKMEKLEAGLVRVTNAFVCRFDPVAWATYGQFTVDIGTGCSLAVAVKGVVPGLNPEAAQGSTIPEIIGTVRNLSGYSGGDPANGVYNVWLLYPRAADDVDCGTATPGCTK